MAYTKKGAAKMAALLALICASCGDLVSPMQSPVEQPSPTVPPPTEIAATQPPATVVLPASRTPRVPPTITGTATSTPTETQTPTPGPSPTPDIARTSAAVFATI